MVIKTTDTTPRSIYAQARAIGWPQARAANLAKVSIAQAAEWDRRQAHADQVLQAIETDKKIIKQRQAIEARDLAEEEIERAVTKAVDRATRGPTFVGNPTSIPTRGSLR